MDRTRRKLNALQDAGVVRAYREGTTRPKTIKNATVGTRAVSAAARRWIDFVLLVRDVFQLFYDVTVIRYERVPVVKGSGREPREERGRPSAAGVYTHLAGGITVPLYFFVIIIFPPSASSRPSRWKYHNNCYCYKPFSCPRKKRRRRPRRVPLCVRLINNYYSDKYSRTSRPARRVFAIRVVEM